MECQYKCQPQAAKRGAGEHLSCGDKVRAYSHMMKYIVGPMETI